MKEKDPWSKITIYSENSIWPESPPPPEESLKSKLLLKSMPMVSFKSELKIKEPENLKKLLLPTIKEDFPKKKSNKCWEMLKNSPNKINLPKKKLTPKTLWNHTSIKWKTLLKTPKNWPINLNNLIKTPFLMPLKKDKNGSTKTEKPIKNNSKNNLKLLKLFATPSPKKYMNNPDLLEELETLKKMMLMMIFEKI